MTESTSRRDRRGVLIIAGRLVLICVMLMAITAMANRNISGFVYQGF